MNLKSFGCSFIFGSELSDDVYSPYLIPSQLTWPAHLAQHLNYEYQCYARPGSGNLQILEQVLTQSATNEKDLFVIGWTWIDRFDYHPTNTDSIRKNPWRTIMPTNDDVLSKVYYRDLHSEYRDKFTCLSYIKLAIDTLNQKGIPFLMTYIDELLFDQHWHSSPAVADLQAYIEPYITRFNGKNFLKWSQDNGYSITTAWHPLEEAHVAAGEYIINIFDKQKTTDLTR